MAEEDRKIRYGPPDFPKAKLSDEATRARRNLIAIMALWILIVPLKLVPKKIVWLGIDLEASAFSVPALGSLAALFFWMSFVVYAFRDWAPWRYGFLSILDRIDDEIGFYESDIGTASKILKNAQEKDSPDAAGARFTSLRSPGSKFNHKIGDIKVFKPRWERDLRNLITQRRDVQIDFYSRSFWDFGLPGLTVLGPIWYLL